MLPLQRVEGWCESTEGLIASSPPSVRTEPLICLPDSAPISKVEATKGFGAQVCLVNGCYDDAYNKALELKDEMGYTLSKKIEYS